MATVSILQGFAKYDDFTPNDRPVSKLPNAYRRFLDHFEYFPGFFDIDENEYMFQVRQKRELYSAVMAKYPFAESEAVAKAVAGMIPEKNSDPSLKYWDLTVVLVSKLDSPKYDTEIIITLVKVQVHLETSQDGQVHFPKQLVTMSIQRHGVNAMDLMSKSDYYFSSFTTTSVEKFVSFMSSPKVPITSIFLSPPLASCSIQNRMAYRPHKDSNFDCIF
ncbi:hypothetical protein BGZ73_007118 [Actinomortierella ambigua]|nr:hypothetical protein BGZ73_007118 [Actinomortierella ambigua]